MVEGKTVNISNVSLLKVFYPDFQFREELFFDHENKVIYVGKPKKNLLKELRENTLDFINTVGVYDYDLDSVDTMVRLVYNKWGKEPKEDDIEFFRMLNDKDYEDYIKLFWVSGVSSLGGSDGVSFYTLYKSLLKPKKELMAVYYELLDKYSPKEIESGIITFLEKVFAEDIDVSNSYRKLLNDFKSRKGEKVRLIINKYRMDKRPVELKLIWFLLSL